MTYLAGSLSRRLHLGASFDLEGLSTAEEVAASQESILLEIFGSALALRLRH